MHRSNKQNANFKTLKHIVMKTVITFLIVIMAISANAQQSNESQKPPIKKEDGITAKAVINTSVQPNRPPLKTGEGSASTKVNNAAASTQANKIPIKTSDAGIAKMSSPTGIGTNAGNQGMRTASSVSVKDEQAQKQK